MASNKQQGSYFGLFLVGLTVLCAGFAYFDSATGKALLVLGALGVIGSLFGYMGIKSLEGMTANFSDPGTRQMIKSSTYLDTILSNAAIVRTDLGVDLASRGRLEQAIEQFEEALRLQPELAVARRNLTTAQQARGRATEGADIR